MTTFFVILTLSLTISITIALKITGRIDLNKIFYYLTQHYRTKKYNKKANDYNRLFAFFHSDLILSPTGSLLAYIFETYNTAIYYPDYKTKKIFILKNDNKRKRKANIVYTNELKKYSSGYNNEIQIDKKDKINKNDYFIHRYLTKEFRYFLRLQKLIENNYTFQEIIKEKWKIN